MRRAPPGPTLVVFVKAPRLGDVKTRLARGIGAVPAWLFYRRITAALLRRVTGDARWRVELAVTPDRFARTGRFWPASLRRRPQGGGDLGQRMARALRRPGPAVIVGSDIPGLRARHIRQAFRALGRHDVVFGPAVDGGYWLVGLRHPPAGPRLFRNVRWSSPHALADTLANLPPGASVALLERLTDVDEAEDLLRLARREPRS